MPEVPEMLTMDTPAGVPPPAGVPGLFEQDIRSPTGIASTSSAKIIRQERLRVRTVDRQKIPAKPANIIPSNRPNVGGCIAPAGLAAALRAVVEIVT